MELLGHEQISPDDKETIVKFMREDWNVDATRKNLQTITARLGVAPDAIVSVKGRLIDSQRVQWVWYDKDYDAMNAAGAGAWHPFPSGPETIGMIDELPDMMAEAKRVLMPVAVRRALIQNAPIDLWIFTRQLDGTGKTLIENQVYGLRSLAPII